MKNENLLLWEVHYSSKYYDNDPRAPGDVPVDIRIYTPARNSQEALTKTEKAMRKQIKDGYRPEMLKANEKIKARPISLDELFTSRDSSQDGRLGFHSMRELALVKLSLKCDECYELAVTLKKK